MHKQYTFVWWTIYLIALYASEPVNVPHQFKESHKGLQSGAIPSLVILGAAKGGTTDLWDMLHNFHSGFLIYSYNASMTCPCKVCPCKVFPWKELNFFGTEKDLCCNSATDFCNGDMLKSLLECPTSIFLNKSVSSCSRVSVCREHMRSHAFVPPVFTATASPALLLSPARASRALLQVYYETGFEPLFMALLREPVQCTISLFNHGMAMSRNSGYAFPLERILSIELSILSSPDVEPLLQTISSYALNGQLSIDGMKGVFEAYQLLQLRVSQALNSHPSSRKLLLGPNHGFALGGSHGSIRSRLNKNSDSDTDFSRHSDNHMRSSSHKKQRLNTRPYGLILNSLYLPQLCGWLSSDLFISSNVGILIAQSEHVFDDRIRFLHDEVFPFLHPNKTEADSFRRHSHKRNTPISNQKNNKHPSAILSESMAQRLRQFYAKFPLDSFFKQLDSYRGRVVVVPRVNLSSNYSWWT